MNSIATANQVTPEDLLEMPDAAGLELVEGELVEHRTSGESSDVAGNVFFLLKSFCRDVGWVFPADAGFQCFADDADKVPKTDVALVRRERLPSGPGSGFLKLTPDLLVEVISPNDLAYQVDQKIREYRAAGVRLIWVVNPEAREVRVHRHDGSISGLAASDELTGEDVLPGFRCRVEDFFAGLPSPTHTPGGAKSCGDA